MSEVRAKSTVVGADTVSPAKGASSEPSYKAITQQIAYLMSAVANQTSPNLNKNGGCARFKSNGNGKYPSTMFQRRKRDKKSMTCWDVGLQGIVGESAPLPDKGILFLLDPTLQA